MTIEEKSAIVKVAKDSVNRYIFERSVGLAVYGENGLRDLGSGMILRIADQDIVITAAHVIREYDPGKIQLIATEELCNVRFSPEAGDFYGGEIDNDLDVGFLRIGEHDQEKLNEKKHLTLDDLEFFPEGLSTDLAIMYGFPATQHREIEMDAHSFRSLTYLTNFPKDSDWAEPGHRPVTLSIGYEESVHDVFTGRDVQLPTPHGMSGGGLWRAHFSDAEIWTPAQLKLVGVLTDFDDGRREVHANRVENLYHLLSNHFDMPNIC